MNQELSKTVEQDVTQYLHENPSQSAIQTARSELKNHRLGRLPITQWELQQVLTVQIADRLLKAALSDTLGDNKAVWINWQRGH